MSRRFFLIGTIICGLYAAPIAAQNAAASAPQGSDTATQDIGDFSSLGNNPAATKRMVAAIGKAYAPMATLFHCDRLAWGALTDSGNVVVEYVPPPDDVNVWTRMLTVTVYPLPTDTPDYLSQLQEKAAHTFENNGVIIQQQTSKDSSGYPRLFIEYEIGEGEAKEHAAGMFFKAGPGNASFVQIQTRTIPVNADDAYNMKLLAEGKISIPQAN